MTIEEFDNMVEDAILCDSDLFYAEDEVNMRLIEVYDYVTTVVNKDGKWVNHFIANENDSEISTLEEEENPKLFWGHW